MNNIRAFSNKQDIQQQACEWISRFDRGLSETEELAFAEWVNISKTHRQCLFEFAQTWDELSVLNELNTLFPLRDSHHRQTNTFSKRTNMNIAASLAFVLISCFAWLVNTQLMSSMDDPSLVVLEAETNVGEHRELSLADGSVIHLNTNSQVSIDFSDTHRDIHLIRGEAHFDVAHDEQRPFIVTAGDNTVTAVGTAFNVQITNPHELELLVTDGKVLVKNQQEINSIPTIAESLHPLDGNGELIVAGQKALINQQSIQQQTLSNEQVQSDLAWQQGMLVFHGEPLAEALQEISRYTSITFTLADEQVKQRRVAGYFKAGDIQGLLFALENNFNIVYSKRDNQTIVLSSGS
ncbi:FecR family protein [Paraglaciecola arctica]|uniref:Transmembrane sensor n=1 Tax=Paraglaciecola arctica BSs20135 TaxID=493475 RepID=K6YL84_9ALTE|nr:FecR domain-containing protein [Paraglaciecola arctica]GAC17368.1 transmembrane sensor [Paraglaciecola arctica BSs20135]